MAITLNKGALYNHQNLDLNVIWERRNSNNALLREYCTPFYTSKIKSKLIYTLKDNYYYYNYFKLKIINLLIINLHFY